METIEFKDIMFTKAERMLRPEGEDPHHKAYTRVKSGKLQMIPQKGAIIKEREDPHLREAKEILGKDYDRFTKDLNAYFHTNREIHEMKTILEDHVKEQEAYMSRIRPLLNKFENLSEEENKFKTEFMAEGFKHKFISYPRETLPYKDLYEESFKRLSEKMQTEVSAMKETLRKVTAQERFERIEKADPLSKMEDHFKNIVRLKEEMLRLMKKVDSNIGGLRKAHRRGESFKRVPAKEVLPKKKGVVKAMAVELSHHIRELESKKGKLSEPMQGWSRQKMEAYADSLGKSMELPKVILEKAKPYTRTRKGKLERVKGYAGRDKGEVYEKIQ